MSTPCVLIAEDEAPLRKMMSRVLENDGFEVVTASDGRRAVATFDPQTHDVIVTDINMPDMDGISLLREVGKRDPDLPVILVTGVPSLKTAIDAVEYGAAQYLTKPFSNQEFLRAVTRAARLRRMARLKNEALALSGLPGGRAGDLYSLEASFERALWGLWIAYQPIVAADGRSVFGYEALMRSHDSALPHPGAILDAAERLARLDELGRAVRNLTTRPMVERPESTLFINLHPRDLMDEDLFAMDAPLTGLAERTVLEITERSTLEAVSNVRERVDQLRGLGFRIAVDDMGAGYAGLTSFAVLQPEFVKIDMTLVRGVHRDLLRQRLIRSFTDLCREMGIQVVAEGIETQDELDAVVECGCDLLQGFYLARPGPAFPGLA